jgi:ATP-dependent exoDNAse (exonuclease V) beta subunit
VRIEAITPEQGADEEEQIKSRIIELLPRLRARRGSWRGIAVLCRANADLEKITSWLLEAGVPVESEKTLNAREHPLIKELVSLLAFLNSPIDELAFASFILGDIFTRASGLPRERIEDFLFKRARGTGGHSYLYREFRQAFPDAWESLLEEFFRNVGFVPLYELVISIYARFRVHDAFPGCQGFLMKFLELVRRQVSEENADCGAFLEYFAQAPDQELYVNVAETDAVRLLSIHKAKGLGFDVVIIPFLEIAVEPGGSGSRPYMVDPESAEGVRLLKIDRHQLAFSPLLSRLFAAEYKRALVDELNTVYVALTRAGSELYAFLPEKSGRALNCCRLLIPEELYSSGDEPGTPAPAKTAGARILLESPGYKSWIPYLREEFIDKQRLLHRERILDGTVMHQALSFITDLSGRDIDAEVRSAIERCRCMFPLYPRFERVEQTLLGICRSAHLKPFFHTAGGEVWCERELSRADGRAQRIDRCVRAGGRTVIIDYKSSKGERGAGMAQLAAYRALLGEITGDKCDAYLLYLDSLELEALDGTG